MELFDSFVRVTFDPDDLAIVLVDYGTPLWGEIRLDGEQIVQEQTFVRAAGIQAFPRGNERHTLAFEICRIEDDMPDAFAARLNASITLPRIKADVLLSLDDGRSWRLKNAAARSWPGTIIERITRESVQIMGGQLIADEGVYTPGLTWGEIALEWQFLG